MDTSISQATILRALSVGWEIKGIESVIFNTKKKEEKSNVMKAVIHLHFHKEWVLFVFFFP